VFMFFYVFFVFYVFCVFSYVFFLNFFLPCQGQKFRRILGAQFFVSRTGIPVYL